MADESLVPDLTEGSRLQIIRATIERGITENLSKTYIATALRNAGLRFANSLFRSIYEDVAGFRAQFEYVTKLRPDYNPREDKLPIGKYPIKGKYGYVGSYLYEDKDRGTIRKGTFRADSDDLLTRAEAESLLQEILDGSAKFANAVTGITYEGAVRNPEYFA